MNQKKNQNLFSKIILLAVLFSMIVIVLGAYTRLQDAGLGCPDWPGCYGEAFVHQIDHDQAALDYDRPVEVHKAWYEMIHRYLAGSLGLIILSLAIFVSIKRKTKYLFISWGLVGVVIFQALLGMWTVTLKLHPLVVKGHLLGGFTTLSLLWWFYLKSKEENISGLTKFEKVLPNFFIMGGVIVLILQIALGGWVSSNYAALACTGFPGCMMGGEFWPEMSFRDGFNFYLEFGRDYEFGHLDSPGRIAVHMAHRVGAVIVFLYLMTIAHFLFHRGKGTFLRRLSLILVGVLSLQVILGISNVIFHLPLKIAVAHNLVASLLLLTMLTIYRVNSANSSS